MDFDGEDNLPVEPREPRPYGQGSWFITLAAAFAVAYAGYKDPYLLPIPDALIDTVKKFTVAAQKPKTPHECMMMALSHSPPVGCEPKQK